MLPESEWDTLESFRMSGSYFDYYAVALPVIDVTEHFGLVAKVAIRFLPQSEWAFVQDTEEYAQGMVGLLMAHRTFEHRMGYRFSTYAYWCIYNEICKYKMWKRRHYGPPALWLSEIEAEQPWLACRPETESRAVRAERLVAKLLAMYPGNTPTKQLNLKVLVDFFLNERTLNEIAQTIGNPETGWVPTKERVRQRKEEALKILQDIAADSLDLDAA